MADFDPEVPLNRIKGESEKAHNALMDYFLMGGGRSFSKLFDWWDRIREGAESYPKEPPTKRFQTLKDWSSKFQWQARIARQSEIDNELAMEQYRQRHMSDSEVMARLADIGRGDMADFANVRDPVDLKEIEQSPLVKKITITERKTQDDTEIAKITIELHSSLKALELIGKDLGRFKDRLDITSGDQPFTIDELTQAAKEIEDWEDENNPDTEG